MGRKTVRWNKIDGLPGWTCTICQNIGIIQKWDDEGTYYVYCSCRRGQYEQKNAQSEVKHEIPPIEFSPY